MLLKEGGNLCCTRITSQDTCLPTLWRFLSIQLTFYSITWIKFRHDAILFFKRLFRLAIFFDIPYGVPGIPAKHISSVHVCAVFAGRLQPIWTTFPQPRSFSRRYNLPTFSCTLFRLALWRYSHSTTPPFQITSTNPVFRSVCYYLTNRSKLYRLRTTLQMRR